MTYIKPKINHNNFLVFNSTMLLIAPKNEVNENILNANKYSSIPLPSF